LFDGWSVIMSICPAIRYARERIEDAIKVVVKMSGGRLAQRAEQGD
jgi:hypothetical protein